VFVTSTLHTGNLGGLAGADAICQDLAAKHLMTGTFRAWLSSGTTNAFDRVSDSGSWYTTKGVLAFQDKLAIRGGTAVDLDDEGGIRHGAEVWSGSDALGDAAGQDCNGWTDDVTSDDATTGSTFSNDKMWGGGESPERCDAPLAIVCFEQ
jgi:hypothetical protein